MGGLGKTTLAQRLFNDPKVVEKFKMHDLMNELAAAVSYPYCVRLDEQKPQESLERVRYLSYNANNYFNNFDRLCGLKCLRTFLSFPSEYNRAFDKELHNLLPAMKHLHLLSLAHCSQITKVLTSTGNLIYLRYLNLSHTDIVSLPSETCKLVNLQTLIVSRCYSLTELPEDIGKLVSLRNLDVSRTELREMPVQIGKLKNLRTLLVSNCSSLIELPEDIGKLMNLCNLDVSGSPLKEMPVQIAQLKNLQTLSNFIVGKQCDGLKVGELEKLPHLKGNLSISELQNVTNPSGAKLEIKKQIDELTLDWHHPAPSNSNSQTQSVVLERLQPAVNLKSLTICGYGGTNFPNWLGDSSYDNMVYLGIINCDNCSCLPPIGKLGKLKTLFIKGMKSVKSVGDEFYGNGRGSSFQPFPSLEDFSFVEMREWEEWNLIGGATIEFPVLRNLVLQECPKLKGKIPTNLPSLTQLYLSGCPLLVEPWSSDDNNNYTSLENLTIQNSCYSMTSFTVGTFPVLNYILIGGCKNLESIVIAEDVSQQQSLSLRRDIAIMDCDELESFSFGGIGSGLSIIPNLRRLRVYSCEKLRSLLEPMNTLVGLHHLGIHHLPSLQSIGKDGFPINLRTLLIGSIGGALWNTIAWERLTCLSKLYIYSGDTVEALMKMELPLLPTSLVYLSISSLGDIECLDGKWLNHLTSLQHLYIYDAPNLRSFSGEEFPSSLSFLSIYSCPLLAERLLDKQGKEWSKIAHIHTYIH